MSFSPVRLNHAVLFVADLERSVTFYSGVFGMEVIAREPRARAAFLRLPASGNHHDLGLFGVGSAGGPRIAGTVGLYHLAWQVDTVDELVEARTALVDSGASTGESSHGATKSIYGADPDGNEFEVMWMLPRSAWGAYRDAAPVERLDLDAEVERWSGVRTAHGLHAAPTSGTDQPDTAPGAVSLDGPMHTSAELGEPVVVWEGSTDPKAPLVVLFHGRGSDAHAIATLAEVLPSGLAYAAVRAPIAEGSGYAWFANRGIGRPVTSSLAATMGWFTTWLDEQAPPGRQVVLVGFSGGAAFAGGLLLDRPRRYAGVAVLAGTLPFDAGVPTDEGRLEGVPVFVAQGDHDEVIPRVLLDRTWHYLTGPAGAKTTAARDPGGHGIADTALGALSPWIRGVLSPADQGSR